MTHTTTTDTRAKQQRGQLIWKGALGWYGRFYADVEGERMRVCRALATDSKAIATRKLARLIASGQTAPAEATRAETFEEAARRTVSQQKAAGMATWKDRERRLETYVFPALGAMQPNAIRASHIRSVLDAARELGKARITLGHIKNDVGSVLGILWRAEVLAENVCARVKLPEANARATMLSKKERAVLTDEELVRYLGWTHPDERQRMAALERQVMACVARMFGGLRTSDLHALTWEGFELPSFENGIAPRHKGHGLAKGGRPQRLVVPEMLRPILDDWWQRQGRPLSGPVFPARRGKHAGTGAKKGTSHAEAFRRDLGRAFGIHALVAEDKERKGRGPLNREVWKAVRVMTPRERELLEETEFTRPVDFHSWRRAFNQALADAGVNAQQAQSLAGHSSMAAHERYLKNTGKIREMPLAALPRLTVGHSTMGTLHELPRPVTTDDAEDPGIVHEYRLAVGFEGPSKPMVGGSSPPGRANSRIDGWSSNRL